MKNNLLFWVNLKTVTTKQETKPLEVSLIVTTRDLSPVALYEAAVIYPPQEINEIREKFSKTMLEETANRKMLENLANSQSLETIEEDLLEIVRKTGASKESMVAGNSFNEFSEIIKKIFPNFFLQISDKVLEVPLLDYMVATRYGHEKAGEFTTTEKILTQF